MLAAQIRFVWFLGPVGYLRLCKPVFTVQPMRVTRWGDTIGHWGLFRDDTVPDCDSHTINVVRNSKCIWRGKIRTSACEAEGLNPGGPTVWVPACRYKVLPWKLWSSVRFRYQEMLCLQRNSPGHGWEAQEEFGRMINELPHTWHRGRVWSSSKGWGALGCLARKGGGACIGTCPKSRCSTTRSEVLEARRGCPRLASRGVARQRWGPYGSWTHWHWTWCCLRLERPLSTCDDRRAESQICWPLSMVESLSGHVLQVMSMRACESRLVM